MAAASSRPLHACRAGQATPLAAAVLALGLLVSSVVLGVFFYKARRAPGTVQVVGAATVPFESDVVKWRVFLSRTAGAGDLQAAYAQVRSDVDGLVRRLEEAGLPPGSIDLQPSSSMAMWGPEGRITGYQVRQGLVVISRTAEAGDAVEALALDPSGLLGTETVLESSQLEYFYENLAELKRSLLAGATDDARSRAAEIAERSGSELGRITTARAGVFQITEPFSTEVSGYGMYNTATRRKEMTVTVHAAFELR